MSGPVLGNFEVVQVLGKGGMGSVYEVRLPGDPRRLALKRIHVANERTTERFRREGELVARLDHPHIVAVRGAGLLPDHTPYLLFDLVEGRSLNAELREHGPLSEERVLKLAKEIASALAHAHERGVVHRDIKPANLLLTEDGRVVLADFGLAVAEDMERMTRTGQLIGTPMYFAPEQINDQKAIGPPTDIHAVGIVLHELLTGTAPFVGQDSTKLFEAILKRAPSSVRAERPEISRDLSALIARCLKKDPDERYADGAALLEALEQVGRGGGRRRLVLGAMTVVSLLAVGAAVSATRPDSNPEPTPAERPLATAPPPASAKTATPAPVVRFLPRWRPPVGSRDDYTIHWVNRNPGADYRMTWRATYEVESSERRKVVIKVTVRSLKSQMTSQMVKSQVDSSTPALKVRQGMEPLRTLVGESYWLELDGERGRVLRVRGASAALAKVFKITGEGIVAKSAMPSFFTDEGLKMLYVAFLVHLPVEPVKQGESWRWPMVLLAPETLVGLNVQARVTLSAKAASLKPGWARFRLRTHGSPVWLSTSPQLTRSLRKRFVLEGTGEWLEDRPERIELVRELGASTSEGRDVTRFSLIRASD